MVIKHYFHPNPSSPYRLLKHKDLTRKTPDDEMQYADFLVERALSFLSSPPSSFPFKFPQNPKSQYQSFAIRIVSLLFSKSANLRSVYTKSGAFTPILPFKVQILLLLYHRFNFFLAYAPKCGENRLPDASSSSTTNCFLCDYLAIREVYQYNYCRYGDKCISYHHLKGTFTS
jgi:hypothetical protein